MVNPSDITPTALPAAEKGSAIIKEGILKPKTLTEDLK